MIQFMTMMTLRFREYLQRQCFNYIIDQIHQLFNKLKKNRLYLRPK